MYLRLTSLSWVLSLTNDAPALKTHWLGMDLFLNCNRSMSLEMFTSVFSSTIAIMLKVGLAQF